jgi:hypothetical protein
MGDLFGDETGGMGGMGGYDDMGMGMGNTAPSPQESTEDGKPTEKQNKRSLSTLKKEVVKPTKATSKPKKTSKAKKSKTTTS